MLVNSAAEEVFYRKQRTLDGWKVFLAKVHRLSLNLKVFQEKRHFEVQSFPVGISLHVHQNDSVMFMVTFMTPILTIRYQ
jgi:hypothetical protein